MAAPRIRPTTDLWNYQWTLDGAGVVEWYTARRGRFVLTEHALDDARTALPVTATLQLLTWEH
jgi:hypothetical protein